MAEYKKVVETDQEKYDLAKHMADIYTRSVYLDIDKNEKITTPSDFAKMYLDCFQQMYDVLNQI